MCEFCKNVITGDDLMYLLDKETDGDVPVDSSTYLCYKDGFPTLETVVDVMYKPIIIEAVSITFCPMCGINLRKEIEKRGVRPEWLSTFKKGGLVNE